MEEQVNRLVNKVWDMFQQASASKRLLIAVSGIPGSGKTTLAAIVSTRLNKRHAQQSPGIANSSPISAFIPMDGYHLSRAQLDAMPDPDSAHARRGAAFTFDGESFLSLVKQLRKPICPETETLYAPSFDHAIKDPVENDIPIVPSVRIVIFEGNYCSLNKQPWKDAAELMDELWFVDVDFEVARKRLVYRHVNAGIAKDEEEAGKRADENDLLNGKEIVDLRLDVHELIKSNEDATWAPEKHGMGDGMGDGKASVAEERQRIVANLLKERDNLRAEMRKYEEAKAALQKEEAALQLKDEDLERRKLENGRLLQLLAKSRGESRD